MTGEITLRARVLPIDGLKEKVLAAHRGDIHTVLIPKDNERDIKEVPPRVLKRVKLILVEHMDEVLDQAMLLKPVCKAFPLRQEGNTADERVQTWMNT
jgi:ATP-dependent Lon protease